MKAFFILTIVFCAVFSAAQGQKFQMNIPTLVCNGKTEGDEDEVYLLITFRKSDGTTGNIRMPFNSHFDMNDVEDARRPNTTKTRFVGTILDFELQNNQRIDIFCSIMEEDNGTASQYNAAGVRVLRIANANNGDIFNTITGNTYKGILANIASSNNISNSDDWIGAVSYRISRNNAGALTINFKRIDNSNSNGNQTQTVNPAPRFPLNTQLVNAANNNVAFAFTGDGSKYNTSITITTLK